MELDTIVEMMSALPLASVRLGKAIDSLLSRNLNGIHSKVSK